MLMFTFQSYQVDPECLFYSSSLLLTGAGQINQIDTIDAQMLWMVMLWIGNIFWKISMLL